jgi:hypothetical protein
MACTYREGAHFSGLGTRSRQVKAAQLWHLPFTLHSRDNLQLCTGGLPKTFEGNRAMNCSIRIAGLSAALILAVGAMPVSAHHSAAPFDMTKQVTLHGTVEKWLWANPHSWLYVRVEKADGSQEVWGFEAGSTGMLARSGWNAADMKPGDKVTVSAAPERDGNHIGLLNQVQLANGHTLNAGAGAPPPGALPPGLLPPGAGAGPAGPPGLPPAGAKAPSPR